MFHDSTEQLVPNVAQKVRPAASLDGSRVRTLVDGLEGFPDEVIVNSQHGHIYWTDMGTAGELESGSGQRRKSGASQPLRTGVLSCSLTVLTSFRGRAAVEPGSCGMCFRSKATKEGGRGPVDLLARRCRIPVFVELSSRIVRPVMRSALPGRTKHPRISQ
jgi:hypothetical protein